MNIGVQDDKGTTLWSFTCLDGDVEPAHLDELAVLKDIDSDGFDELLAQKYYPETSEFELCCFDDSGEILWTRQFKTAQTFKGIHIDDDYRVRDIKVTATDDGEPLLLVAWINRGRFLSSICSYDISGELIDAYLHVGHLAPIEIIDYQNDGTEEIVFGATNNLLNGEGVLGILPLEGFSGISPPYRVEPEYEEFAFKLSNYVPDDPEPGNQLLYLRFRSLGYLKDRIKLYRFAHILQIMEDNVTVHISEWRIDSYPGTFGPCYVLDKDFRLQSVFPSATGERFYDKLLADGEIDISMDELLERYSHIILRWQDGRWIPN
jgi:hypothetical protein